LKLKEGTLNAEFFRTMFDYHYWARDRLLKAAEGLPESEYAAENGFSNYGSIRAILTHAMGAEGNYMRRWTGEQGAAPKAEEVPTVESLHEYWRQQEGQMRSYIAGLSDEDVNREIVTPRRDGGEFRRPLWQDLIQVINHGTQHRSEAAEALTKIGRSPGNLDASVYFQEKSA
jgi:uncharacterized damage-inducible protein DinB